jgi:putative ABC transport system substrate-binding protein
LAAKSGTATIPIVFITGVDPVELGLVRSLNRPGGNLTGVITLTFELVSKRVELLHEIVPAARSIGFLINPTNSQTGVQVSTAEAAARTLGLRLVTQNASTSGEIEAAFGILAGQQIAALLVAGEPFLFAQRDQLATDRAFPMHGASPEITPAAF